MEVVERRGGRMGSLTLGYTVTRLVRGCWSPSGLVTPARHDTLSLAGKGTATGTSEGRCSQVPSGGVTARKVNQSASQVERKRK